LVGQLRAGPDVTVPQHTAHDLRGLSDLLPREIHVTVPRTTSRRREWLRPHTKHLGGQGGTRPPDVNGKAALERRRALMCSWRLRGLTFIIACAPVLGLGDWCQSAAFNGQPHHARSLRQYTKLTEHCYEAGPCVWRDHNRSTHGNRRDRDTANLEP